MFWFTADTHFNHETMAVARGFLNAEEHDRYIIMQINRHVGRNDNLFILGDFALDKPARYRPQLTCRHVRLIIGNHDRPLQSMHTFGDTPKVAKTKIQKHNTMLCHYPSAFWDQSHNGSFHLYGHCHGHKEDVLDAAFPGRRAIDVGMDNAKRLFDDFIPFNELWLFNTLIERPGHDHPEKRGDK